MANIPRMERVLGGLVTPPPPKPPKPRDFKTKKTYTIVGLKEPHLTIGYGSGGSAVSKQVIADDTTYPDRIIIKIKNQSTTSFVINGASIRGKMVSQLAGESGYKWEYSDYNSIERNSEISQKVTSDYIVSQAQCKAVGDYQWKNSRNYGEYTLTLNGQHYQYAIGDTWTLAIDYTLNGKQLEYISTNVVIMGVSYKRTVDGIGTTELSVKVPPSAWAQTMAREAVLTGSGKSQWMGNRSNIVTVAASDYIGQADFYCDGTNDNVEIQAAIDYVSNLEGGEVRLTNGLFIVDSINIASSIMLTGQGKGTLLRAKDDTLTNPYIIGARTSNIVSITLTNFTIDCAGINLSSPGDYINGIDISLLSDASNLNINNVEVCNMLTTTADSISGIMAASLMNASVSNCYIHDITAPMAAIGIRSFADCKNNRVHNLITATYRFGFFGCKRCLGNRVTGSYGTKYNTSYADSGTANPCADTADGGYNS